VEPEVAAAISLVALCREFHTLPGPGGLLDQDPLFAIVSSTVLSADAERQEKEMKKTSKGRR
jgi:hypothetical protein